jgi:hypothetical protein
MVLFNAELVENWYSVSVQRKSSVIVLDTTCLTGGLGGIWRNDFIADGLAGEWVGYPNTRHSWVFRLLITQFQRLVVLLVGVGGPL